jgi:Icc-related predicted phosphoesterase
MNEYPRGYGNQVDIYEVDILPYLIVGHVHETATVQYLSKRITINRSHPYECTFWGQRVRTES